MCAARGPGRTCARYELLITTCCKTPAIHGKPTFFRLAAQCPTAITARTTSQGGERGFRRARGRSPTTCRGGYAALSEHKASLGCDCAVSERQETRVGAQNAHDSGRGSAAACGGPELWLRRHQSPAQGPVEQVWVCLALCLHMSLGPGASGFDGVGVGKATVMGCCCCCVLL